MPRPMTEKILARRNARPVFEKRQARKIFTLPGQLTRVIERGCDRYDISESEFIRRLIFCYALDLHGAGPWTQYMDEFFSTKALSPPDGDEACRYLAAELPKQSEQAIRMADAAVEALRSGEVASSLAYWMEHVEEFIEAIDANTAIRKGAPMKQPA